MRHLKCMAMMFVAVAMVMGCKNKNGATLNMNAPVDDDSVSVADSTVYGRCGESTAMHTLEVITDKSDTLLFMLGSGTADAEVLGGLMVGDRLAVMTAKDEDGTDYASKVINMTTLLGKWGSLDKNFEIKEGGEVVSNITEPKPYTDWRVLNGKLLLSTDTFDIYSLGADSLLLENDHGIYAYKRLK